MKHEIDDLLAAVNTLAKIADPAIAKTALTCVVRVLTSGLDPLEVLKEATSDRNAQAHGPLEINYEQFVN